MFLRVPLPCDHNMTVFSIYAPTLTSSAEYDPEINHLLKVKNDAHQNLSSASDKHCESLLQSFKTLNHHFSTESVR